MPSLKEVSERISHHGFTGPSALQQLKNVAIKQVVLGPNHVALLLDVCLLSFRTIPIQIFHHLISLVASLCSRMVESVVFSSALTARRSI